MTSSALTLEQAAAILRDVLPGAQPSRVARLEGGESGGAHLVTFDGDFDPVVAKVYRADGVWMLGKEVAAYRLLRKNGVDRIPRLYGGASAPDSAIGLPYLVMSRLPGRMAEAILSDASPDTVASVYRQMGEVLHEINAIRMGGFGYRIATSGNADDGNDAFMTRVFEERTLTYLERTGDRGLVDAARAHVADRAGLLARCGHPVLLHGDFHEGNAIVDTRDGEVVVTGVIDLENAMAGDPLMDLARVDNFENHRSQFAMEALFEGYGSVPDDWGPISRLYQLIHDFELWVWYAQEGRADSLPPVVADIEELLRSE